MRFTNSSLFAAISIAAAGCHQPCNCQNPSDIDGASGADAQPPFPQVNTTTKTQIALGNLAIRLDGCLRSGTTVTCKGVALSPKQDAGVKLCHAKATDDQGKQYEPAVSRAGGQGLFCVSPFRFAADTPVAVDWTFNNVPTDVMQFVSIDFLTDKFTGLAIEAESPVEVPTAPVDTSTGAIPASSR